MWIRGLQAMRRVAITESDILIGCDGTVRIASNGTWWQEPLCDPDVVWNHQNDCEND